MSAMRVPSLPVEDIKSRRVAPDYYEMVSSAIVAPNFSSRFASSSSNITAAPQAQAQAQEQTLGVSGVSLVTSTTLSTPVGDVEIRIDEYVDSVPANSAQNNGYLDLIPRSISCDSARSEPLKTTPRMEQTSHATQSASRSKQESTQVGVNARADGQYAAYKDDPKLKTASSETTLDEEVFLIDERRLSSSPLPMPNDHRALAGHGHRLSADMTEVDDVPGNLQAQNDCDGDDNGFPFGRKAKPSSVRGTLRRALSSKRRHRRLIFKDGTLNISSANVEKKKRRYLVDLFTTLVDIKWRYSLLLFTLTFIGSWLFFASVWYILAFAHGDLEEVVRVRISATVTNTSENRTSEGAEVETSNEKCIEHINSFLSAILFSIETQQTIGFGHRYATDVPGCGVWNIMVMMMQSCCGVIIQALMTGIVFAKLSRPKKRAQTLMFSKNAVICTRDGESCLLFRVGDMRKSHIINTHIRGIMIQKRTTQEGEQLPLSQYEVDFGFTDGTDRPFLIWPVLVEHKITPKSPFWHLTARNLKRMRFELIVILEGIVESTGMTTQARSSYLPNEILWGHRFEKLISYEKDNGQFHIDFSKFHETMRIENFTTESAAEICSKSASSTGKKLPIVTVSVSEDGEDNPKAVQANHKDYDSNHLSTYADDDEDALSSITCSSARTPVLTRKNSDSQSPQNIGNNFTIPVNGSDASPYNHDERLANHKPVTPRRLSIPVDISRPLMIRRPSQNDQLGRRLKRLNPTSELSVSFSMLNKEQ